MAKYANPLIMDRGLAHLGENTTRLVACQGQPATYAEATTPVASGNLLGALGELDANDFPISNAVGGGRLVTVLGQTVQVDYSGTFDHVALVDDVNDQLLYVIPVTASRVVVGGDTINIGDTTITIQNPA